MANDIATTDQADGRLAQAWRALNLLPSTTSELALKLGNDAPACLDAAIAKVEHDLRPVPADTGRKEWEYALDERLRRLAVKALPTARPSETIEWRKAMWEALSDLPAMISLTAAKRAIHRAYRFIGDIEPAIREIAADILAERQALLSTLKRHRDEIGRAVNPPTALPPADEGRPLTDDEIRAVAKLPAWPDFKIMGLKLGSFTEEDLRRALHGDVTPEAEAA